MGSTITLQGVPEMLRKITKLGDSLHGREATNLARKAARLVRNNIRAAAPKDVTGRLRKSLKVRTKRGQVLVWSDFNTARIVHLIEFGTAERHYTTKRGRIKSTGRLKPNPFFSKGRNKSRSAVAEILQSGYILILERTATAK